MFHQVVKDGEIDRSTVASIVHCLRRAYRQALGRSLSATDEEIERGTLRDLGMDSSVTLVFLVEVENEFGVEWRDDTAVETLRSVASVAEYIANELR
jgi:acyl carrier protein